jgi:hypothetical protein
MSKNKSTDLPTTPDFSFIQGRGASIMKSVYNLMCQNPNYWDIIFNNGENFSIYSTNKNMIELMRLINDNCPYKTDESGIKKTWVMRQLTLIIFNGFAKYKQYVIKGILCPLDYNQNAR